MFSYTALTRPVATATPTSKPKIARPYRWIPEHKLAEIERIEEEHRETIAEIRREQERRRLEAQPFLGSGRHPVTVSSRQAVIAEYGELPRRMNRGDGERSRSHSRTKARLRDRRTIRQLALAA